MDAYEEFFPPMRCADPQPPYFLTAYEIAVKHGFRGTEEEWLISLTAFSMAKQAGYAGTLNDWLAVMANPVPDLQIGEVMTLQGGSNATASITGDRHNPTLNLGIPRGIGADDALPLVGGTMQGDLKMDGHSITGLPNPTDQGDAVPKGYADKMLPLDGTRAMENNLPMNGKEIVGLPTPTKDDSAAPKGYVDKMLPKAGGSMTGDINMSNHRISNVAKPVQEADATNKAYVDDLHKFFTVTLPASGWSSSVPHWQTITREDILESDNPHWGLHLIPASHEEWYAHKEAFDCVDALYTEDGKLHFVCGEYKPEIDLTIQLEVNR